MNKKIKGNAVEYVKRNVKEMMATDNTVVVSPSGMAISTRFYNAFTVVSRLLTMNKVLEK